MGSPRQMFKKKVLAASVAALASVSYTAVAQDAPVEEVLVTGIRASLENAMDIKRESSGVVDAISSEDIGKMPDQNLAESLQRITGLSISRTNGEGSQVTARGIDARFNMVTLNGRNMPAVNNDGTVGDNATRAFDFANIASEGVSGIEVYKTGKANVTSGGLGATVNIKTLKPLEAGETKFIAGAKAVHDTTVRNGSEVTPEVSGLFNWVNDEDTFGISVVGSFQERDSGRANAFVNRWDVATWDGTGVPYASYAQLNSDGEILTPAGDVWSPTQNADGEYVRLVDGEEVVYLPVPGEDFAVRAGANIPALGQLYNMPTDLRYAIEDNERVRTNGQITMQFRPVETITATVDYTYSENKLGAKRSQQSTWFGASNLTFVNFDDNQVKAPRIYVESYPNSFKDVAFAQQDFSSATQNDSLGFNVAFEPNDLTKFVIDYHDSSAKNVASRVETGMAAQTAIVQVAEFNDSLPLMGVVFDDCFTRPVDSSDARNGLDGNPYESGNCNGVMDAGDITTTIGQFDRAVQQTDIKQLRLLGEVQLEGIEFFEESKLSFGLESRGDKNNTKEGQNRITMGNWGGVDPDRFSNDLFTAEDFSGAFPDFNFIGDSEVQAAALASGLSQDDLNSDSVGFMQNGFTANPYEVLEVVEWMNANPDVRDPNNFNSFVNGKGKSNGLYRLDRTIEENVTSGFVQFDARFDLGGMDAGFVLGLKYEDTDITSTSNVRLPLYLEWESDDDWDLVLSSAETDYVVKSSYNNFLPNLDFDLGITEDIKARLSYSTTIARAEYNRLSSAVNITTPYLSRTARAGNPELLPMESDNIDLTVEWYYTEDSYASVGFFRKDVSNFIGDSTSPFTQYGLTDPLLSAEYLAIVNAPGGPDANTEAAFLAFAEARGFANPTQESVDIPALSSDPAAIFQTTLPTNNRDAVIDGFELAVQHWFGMSGFGVQANATIVDADVQYEILETDQQFAMIGLSDSANLIGFYEKDAWQVRVAYNWRDSFIDNTAISGNEPRYTEEFSQIDFSIGYDINDNLSVTLEGLNVTGEDSRKHGRTTTQMLDLEDLGARYAAGIRYTF